MTKVKNLIKKKKKQVGGSIASGNGYSGGISA